MKQIKNKLWERSSTFMRWLYQYRQLSRWCLKKHFQFYINFLLCIGLDKKQDNEANLTTNRKQKLEFLLWIFKNTLAVTDWLLVTHETVSYWSGICNTTISYCSWVCHKTDSYCLWQCHIVHKYAMKWCDTVCEYVMK